jgi:hypothetical protein
MAAGPDHVVDGEVYAAESESDPDRAREGECVSEEGHEIGCGDRVCEDAFGMSINGRVTSLAK